MLGVMLGVQLKFISSPFSIHQAKQIDIQIKVDMSQYYYMKEYDDCTSTNKNALPTRMYIWKCCFLYLQSCLVYSGEDTEILN